MRAVQSNPLLSPAIETPRAALAVGAHPDDIEFHCGATLAKWAASGTAIHLVVCTDGSKGTWDVDADTDALIARRQDEQGEAARRIHPTATVDSLGQVDGELVATVDLRGELARLIRQYQPDVVFGHDPWRRWRMHPDHRAAGFLTVDAVVAARDPHYHRDHMTDGLSHHRPHSLLLFECEEPNYAEPIDDTHLDAKVAALLAHESQYETTMHIDGNDDGAQRAAFEERTRAVARDHAQSLTDGDDTDPDTDWAEAFRWMDPAS